MARYRFEFWLDEDKPEERELMDKIRALKDRNKFAPTLRTGIILVPDLDKGNYEVLEQMYPGVLEKWAREKGILAEGSQPPPPPQNNKTIEDKLDMLTDVILQQHVGKEMQSAHPAPKPLGQGMTGKQIAAPTFDMPTFDEDITFDVRANASVDSSMNLIASLGNIQ